MIEHVYRRASEARGVDAVIVATDDARIEQAVERFGGVVRMTSAAHRTGTDRVAEVIRDLPCEIVVTVQGDEPMIDPATITAVIAPLLADASVQMSTACCAIADPSDYTNPHVVKVVRDCHGDALYFSRAPIPSGLPRGGPSADVRPRHVTGSRHGADADDTVIAAAVMPSALKHLGLYAYRRDFLLMFATLPQTPLERSESLEQLRALEHGYRIRTIETRDDSIGVDTPEDLERARRKLQALRAGEVA